MKTWELVNFCEFDKYASQSYCAVHGEPEEKNLGDINFVDEHNLSPFNCMFFGSPCTDFSCAGNQEGSMWECKDCGHKYNPITVHYSERKECPKCGSTNLTKTRSSLLVEALRVLEANRPSWGIFENVKNLVGAQFKYTFKKFLWELDEYGYNTYYQVLNAKDYGIPQNRERVFVVFIKKELDNGTFVFPKGFDNGLRVKDFLLDSVDEKYYINTPQAQKLIDDLVASGKLDGYGGGIR